MTPRIIISGGGTGGHIFPALSIAEAIKTLQPEADILFVGAEGKMEMEKVPAAGYRIEGLPVAGLERRLTLSNLSIPLKVYRSLRKAGRILRDFRPHVAVGVGGYASAPLLWKAASMGIPTLIQEQNSYAGLTNKILSKKARKICVAYDGMERFFPSDRILLTGNPVRGNIRPYTAAEHLEGTAAYGLDPEIPTVLILGGSGGCGTFNSIMKNLLSSHRAENLPYQIIWQSGKGYAQGVKELFSSLDGAEEKDALRSFGPVRNCDFISRMDQAFAAADLIVSRAGAGTISELCIIGKATIFVPSPNVTEDHQTHNAMAIVQKQAAAMVTDAEAPEKLLPAVEQLLKDSTARETFSRNIVTMARPDAAMDIAREVLTLIPDLS